MSVAIVGSAYVDVHAITDKVEKQISRAFEKIKDVTVNVAADISKALSESEAVASAIDAIDAEVEISANTEAVTEAVEDIESNAPHIQVNADTEHARQAIDDLISDEDGQEVTIAVNPSTAIASARFSWLARSRVVDFVAQVNEKSMAKTAAALYSISGGKNIVKSLDNISTYLLDIGSHAPKIANVGTAIMGIGGAVSAAISNVLVLGGSLASIAGAGLVLPGILAGFATGLMAMVIALKDSSKYLGDLKYLFTETKSVISSNFWEPAVQPIREMITSIMPAFNANIGLVSQSLGGWAAATASAMQQWVTADHLRYVMKNLSDSIDIAATGMNPLIEALITLFQIGSEYLPDLAEWFVRISERFNNFIQGADSDGKLREWIDNGIQGLYDLGKVISEASGIFYGLYTAAEAAGGSTLGTLGDALARIHTIVDSPAFQTTLIQVFRGGHAAMEGMLSALEPIGAALGVLGPYIETSLGLAGQVIGQLGTNIASLAGQAEVGQGLQDMFSGILSGAQALSPAMEPLGLAIGALGGVIGELAANSGPLLASVLLAVSGPAQTLFEAVQPLIPILGESLIGIVTSLAPTIQSLATTFADMVPVIVSVVSVVADIVAALVDGLGPALPGIIIAVTGLVAAIKTISTVHGAFSALSNSAKIGYLNFLALKDGALMVAANVGVAMSTAAAKVRTFTAAVAASAAGQKIAAAATVVWNGIQAAFNAVMALNPIMLIVIAIAALVAGVVLAYNKIGWFKDFVNGAFELIKQGVQVLVDFWNNTLVPMFQSGLEAAGNFVNGVGDWFSGVGESISTAFEGVVAFVTGVMESISSGIRAVIDPILAWWDGVWGGIVTAFQAYWNALVWFYEPIINLIIATVRFFVDTFMAIWNGVWPIVFAIFEGIWLSIQRFFGPIIQSIVDTFHAVIDGVVSWWTIIWQMISDYFTTTWNNLVAFITPILSFIGTAITNGINLIQQVWTMVWTAVSTFFSSIWNGIVSFISPIISTISNAISVGVNAIQAVWSVVWMAISNFFSIIWNGISNAASSFINTVRSVISGVLNGISSLWNSTWSAISGYVSGVWSNIVGAVSGFVGQVRTNVTNVLTTIGNLGSDIMGKVANFPSLLLNAGRDLINGLTNGINNARHMVVDKIKEIAAGALDAVKDFFGIKSPSRVMRDQVGLQIGAGLALGIEKSIGKVKSAAEKLSEAAMIDTPNIELPSVSGGGSSFAVPRVSPSSSGSDLGTSASTSNLGASTIVNFQVNPSAGLSEEQIGESAMEHMFWKLQTQP